MTRRFVVRTIPRFDRLLRHLSDRHPELAAVYARAIEILEIDPYSAGRNHPIRKLEGVTRDEGGQYRLRLGRFRFRYDMSGGRSCCTTAASGERTPTGSSRTARDAAPPGRWRR